MKKLKTIISKITIILITISLVVFSAIPNNNAIYADTSISELQQQIVDYAKQWVGVTPYVWGGTSLTAGADCSGFVMKVYEQFGIKLPHGTASLLDKGAPVSWSDVQLGDIIITESSASGTGKHTGIYAGDGKWVNASTSSVGTVLSDVLVEKIITIRRIVGNLQSDGSTPTVFPGSGGVDGLGGASGQGFKPQGEIDNTDDNPIDLDALEFDFSGSPSKVEYNGEKNISIWLFSKFSQFIDYILGIMLQGIKGAVVGWTAIIEGMVSDTLSAVSDGMGNNNQ